MVGFYKGGRTGAAAGRGEDRAFRAWPGAVIARRRRGCFGDTGLSEAGGRARAGKNGRFGGRAGLPVRVMIMAFLGKILEVNLTEGTVAVAAFPERWARDFLRGRGLNAWLMHQRVGAQLFHDAYM